MKIFEANIANEDALAFDYWGMKFDVIAGNPPYNQGGGGTQSLYHKFIEKITWSFSKENGYLVYVKSSRLEKTIER
jgi:type I restriction-modification system DNA methylase subunit